MEHWLLSVMIRWDLNIFIFFTYFFIFIYIFYYFLLGHRPPDPREMEPTCAIPHLLRVGRCRMPVLHHPSLHHARLMGDRCLWGSVLRPDYYCHLPKSVHFRLPDALQCPHQRRLVRVCMYMCVCMYVCISVYIRLPYPLLRPYQRGLVSKIYYI
jgi:hypothetical protein